jgi:hypothetical protein
MFSEEYTGEFQVDIWKAGEIAPAGTYVRIDEPSYRVILLECEGPLPATFDGHVAFYRVLPRIDVRQVEQQLIAIC